MYRLSRLAAEDFAGIYVYSLTNFGVQQADAYTEGLESVFQLLAATPLLGRERPDIAAAVRCHEHGRHVIFYRAQTRGIIVVRILHLSMEPLKHFGLS